MPPPNRDSLLPPRTRRILHLDVDAFLASVEQALHPELRGRPVVVGGLPDSRNLVMSCSYEARAFGVHPGMRSSEAARLCPRAIFRHGDSGAAARLRERVVRILLEFSPLVEVASIDDFLVDLTGTTRLAGAACEVAERIRERVRDEVSLPLTIGIGTSRTLARLAGKLAKPGGIAEILPGHERAFLAPMPIEHLPGVGHRIRRQLRDFSIHTVGELALVSREVLFASFGPPGLLLYDRARAIDRDPIVATHRLESRDGSEALDRFAEGTAARVTAARVTAAGVTAAGVTAAGGNTNPMRRETERARDDGTEDRSPAPGASLVSIRVPRSIHRDSTFEPEEGRREIVEAMLAYVIDRATAHLRACGLACASIEVRLVYVDTRPAHLRRRDPGGGNTRARVRRPLPGRVGERATDNTERLRRHALELFRSLPRRRALVKRVGVTLSSLRPLGGHQGELFSDPDSDRATDAGGSRADRDHRLDDALDRLRERHGFGRILRGSSLPLKEGFPLGPDGFRLRTPSLNQ